jgi:hypothetical protein
MTGGITQAVECLLCKHEALNSNPSSTKKKKKAFEWDLGDVSHVTQKKHYPHVSDK